MPGSRTSRTAVVSSSPSAARTCGARTRAPAPATDRVVRNWRRVYIIGIGVPPWSLCLELAFELVEKPPIGTFGDDFLWDRFDQPGLMQPQCVEAQRVLGVVVAPLVIEIFAQCLQR